MNNAQLINQDSGNSEWYTEPKHIEAARATMGTIDLDPASCEFANMTVRAAQYFTKADNGLLLPWFGRVWMNHPYDRLTNPKWINKLLSEYKAGHVAQACCITYASTSESWFQLLCAYPMCFLTPRPRFLAPGGIVGKSPTKGCAVTYLGPNVDRFAREFANLGHIMVPYQVPGTDCAVCERGFNPKRTDTLYCSAACRQKAKRRCAPVDSSHSNRIPDF